MFSRLNVPAFVCLSMIAVVSCNDLDSPTDPESDAQASVAKAEVYTSQSLGSSATIDDRFAEIAREVPGFGGAFYDEGDLKVYLTDTSKKEAARSALGFLLKKPQISSREDRNPDLPELIILDGAYDFRDLKSWRLELRQLLAFEGIYRLGIDEGRNRVVIGVADQATVSRVETAITDMEIPLEAVIVEETSPVRSLADLRDYIRPVEGGLKIDPYLMNPCTVTGSFYLESRRSYLTASHCTHTQAEVEGTEHYQPSDASSSNLIGSEYADPPLFSCIEASDGCRYSDVAVGEYLADVSSHLGLIARTTFADPLNGSITIDSDKPHFYVEAESPYPALGEELEKVGQKTGWTYGKVTGTCDDYPGDNPNLDIYLKCQDKVDAGSDTGDSGSPVFLFVDDRDDYVTLYGVLWGEINGEFLFSNMERIESELGELTSYGPLTTIEGPRDVSPNVTETWTAGIDGGRSPYTYEWYRDGIQVDTDDTYTANTGDADFQLELYVTDQNEQQGADTLYVNVTYPLDVSISGPSLIQPDATCTWFSDVSGGESPYAYTWTNDGVAVSDSASYTGGQLSDDTDDNFLLELFVDDSKEGVGSDSLRVFIDSDASMCLQ